jgi:protein SCO1/2
VQVLFVTVDPARDTQEVLRQFVPSFDKRFIGLRGSLQETAETLANFKIFYSKVEGKTKDDYSIDHSAGMYVFDKKGKIRLYINYGEKPVEMASDVSKLL